MKRMLAGLAALLVAATASSALATPAAQAESAVPKATNGEAITKRVRAAIDQLPVAREVRRGYERNKFKHWNDVNHDCQNARSEVLRQETQAPITGECTVKTGRWVSQYDGLTFTKASGLDVDHMVPLAEAWDSGARKWTAEKREAYANDLTELRTLIAVSASSNRSKSDQDPAEWLPDKAVCRYVVQWTVVKVRWGLTVNKAEKAALKSLAADCPNRRFTTYRAVVKNAG